MLPSGSSTVLADFGGATSGYTTAVTSIFFRRDGRYWVRTDGPEGSPMGYPLAYSFTIYFLRQ